MKLERSNVEFAIWRKKVDKSPFEHNGTTIPEWACRMWHLPRTQPVKKWVTGLTRVV